jgi:hypothetical protein
MIFGGSAFFPFISFFSPGSSLVGYLGIFSSWMVIGIPVFAMVLLISKYFSPFRLKRNVKHGMWAFWFINLLAFVLIGVQLAFDFKSSSSIQESIVLDEIVGDTLNLNIESYEFDNDAFIQFATIDYHAGQMFVEDVNLRIEKSDQDKIELIKKINSQGRNDKHATKRAMEVESKFDIVGNTLNLQGYYSLRKGNKYRAQEVDYILKVPAGTHLNINKNADRFLSWRSFDQRFEIPNEINNYYWEINDEGLFSNAWIKENNYEKVLEYKNVRQLNIEGNLTVDITKGESGKIRLVGNEKEAETVELINQDERLNIQYDVDGEKESIALYVEIPAIDFLHLKNTLEARIEGFNEESLEIHNSYGGDLKAYIEVVNLKLTLEGRNECAIIGEGSNLNIQMYEGAKLDGERYGVKTAEITGQLRRMSKIKVSDQLTMELNDADYLKVYGDPTVTHIE